MSGAMGGGSQGSDTTDIVAASQAADTRLSISYVRPGKVNGLPETARKGRTARAARASVRG